MSMACAPAVMVMSSVMAACSFCGCRGRESWTATVASRTSPPPRRLGRRRSAAPSRATRSGARSAGGRRGPQAPVIAAWAWPSRSAVQVTRGRVTAGARACPSGAASSWEPTSLCSWRSRRHAREPRGRGRRPAGAGYAARGERGRGAGQRPRRGGRSRSSASPPQRRHERADETGSQTRSLSGDLFSGIRTKRQRAGRNPVRSVRTPTRAADRTPHELAQVVGLDAHVAVEHLELGGDRGVRVGGSCERAPRGIGRRTARAPGRRPARGQPPPGTASLAARRGWRTAGRGRAAVTHRAVRDHGRAAIFTSTSRHVMRAAAA